MLLRQIKSESYGVLRYKPFRPSLSAKQHKWEPYGFPFVVSGSARAVAVCTQIR